MRALDAMMSLLPRRRSSVGRHEVARYTMTDFFNWQSQSMGYGGHQYGLGGSYGLNTTYGNRPVEAIGNSFEGYAGGLLFCDGPVASAEAYRLRVFGQAPMLFQKRVAGRPGDYYDDDSLNLFRRPWMGGTCSDLMKRALIHGDLGGQAYIVEIDGELVLLRPDWVEIVLAKRMYEGYQVGWTQVGIAYYEGGVGVTSDPALFVAGEYIHFVPGMPDPLATYRGMSWLTPVIREIQADKGASDHKVKWFENAATPNLAVSLPKEVTPTQFNEFVEQMDAKHKGAANAYKTLYTGGGADVTVIGANMQQMDFSNVEGKGETRIANAAGVPSTLLGFSEGMQGSSLNAGNYGPTKRNFVDTTGRDLWQNWCGSAEVLFPPPKDGDRLWYDPRDIPFLHEDQTDVATIKQIEASTMVSLVTAGFEKDSIIAATVAGDWSLLVDSGLVSVQLLPPGTTANDTAAPTGESGTKAPAAKRSREVARKFNPDQPRIPGGHEGGGRWGSGAIGSLIGSLKAIGGLGDVKFGDDGDDGLIDWSTRTSDGGFSFEASDENGEGVNFDLTRLEMSGLHEALTQHLTGDNDPGEFRYGEGDTGYIDWSSKKWVEFSSPDGEDAAVLNMPEERRQQWHTALTLSLLVDATGEAKRSLIHSLEAVARSQTAAGDAGPKAPAAASTPKGPPAKRSREVARKFNPDQPRIPGGHDGGGRWGTVGALKGTILSAVQDLETRPRAPVRIVDLRAHLADVPRADLDRTLKEMDLDGAVQLEPDPVRSKLTPEDKRDAISLGGEDMHLVVRMSDPAGESGPKAPAAKRSREVVRRGFDPDQPRIDAGLEGGGRWGAVGRFMNRLAVHHGPGEIVPLSGKVNGEHGQVRVAHVIDITRGEHYIIVGSGTAAQLSGWHHTADYDGRTALFSSPDELASGLRRVIDDAEAGRTTGPYRIDGADLGDVDLEAAQTPEGPRVRLTTADYESQAIYETDPPPATFEDEDGNPRPLTDEERADWVAEQEAEATAANAASAAGYALLTPDQARQVLASLHLGPPPVTARSVMRKFNPDQPRIPGGHEGGGRWGSGEGLIQKLVHALTGQDALDAAPATYTSGPNAHFGNYEGATFDAPSGAGDPQALAEYEGLEYQQTNLFLRGQYRNDPVTGLPPTGEEDFLQGVNGRIAEIDKTMRVSGLTADVEVSRAIKDGKSVFGPAWTEGVMNAATTDFDEQDREYERWKAGERPDVTGLSWTERGYLSTSASDDHSKAFGERWARMAREMPGFEGEPVIMTIRVPAGTGAVQLGNLGFTEGPHGRQIMGSAELLMQRGLTMTVTADHGVDADGFRRLDVEVTRVRT